MEDGAPGGFQSSYPMPNLTEGILDSTYLRPPPWPHPMTDTTTSSNPRDWPSTKESSPASFGGDDFSDSKRLTESPLSDSELYAPSLSHSASTNSSGAYTEAGAAIRNNTGLSPFDAHSPNCGIGPNQENKSESHISNTSESIPCEVKECRKHICLFPGCTSTGFGRSYDLQRHQRKHNPNSKKFVCGCCITTKKHNGYKATRLDHLMQHMRSVHQMAAASTCPDEQCINKGHVLFSTEECVEEHRRQAHGGQDHGSIPEAQPSEHGVLGEDQRLKHNCAHEGILDPSQQGRNHGTLKRKNASSDMPRKPKKQHEFLDMLSHGYNYHDTFGLQFPTPGPPTGNGATRSEAASMLPLYAEERPGIPGFGANDIPQQLDCAFDFMPSYSVESDLHEIDDWHDSYRCLAPLAADPLRDNTLAHSHIGQWILEEVREVHPIDFLALLKANAFRAAEDTLSSAIKALRITNVQSISYNSKTETVKLQGPLAATQHAKNTLQTRLLELSNGTGHACIVKRLTKVPDNYRKSAMAFVPETGRSQRSSHNDSAKIFVLRESDTELIKMWMNHLLPSLPKILAVRLGQDYTASLVRQGSTENWSRPCVRIQAHFKPHEATQKAIERAIHDICGKCGQGKVAVRFSRGRVRLLAGPADDEASLDQDAESDDSEDEDNAFIYSRRYSQRPGMGSSIGMRCTKLVSATLGGYLLVDSGLVMLTVNHFIEHSEERNDNSGAAINDPQALTSPSLYDVDEMKGKLETTLRGDDTVIMQGFESFGETFGNTDIDLGVWNDNLNTHPALIPVNRAFVNIRMSLLELRRREEEFVFGRVAYRCTADKVRNSTGPMQVSGEKPKHRMDWCTFSVDDTRRGENRHRFAPGINPEDIDYTPQNNRLPGELCDDTSDPRPGAEVYYVGQKGGLQTGYINHVLELHSERGVDTQEWAIICHQQKPTSVTCGGDSGAWVITRFGNRLVGLLWGWNDGKLLFTPIKDIFADIKETHYLDHVGLPPRPPQITLLPPANPQTTVQISGIKKRAPNNFKPYKFFQPKLYPNNSSASATSIYSEPYFRDTRTELPVINHSVQSDPPSPAPSLGSSVTSQDTDIIATSPSREMPDEPSTPRSPQPRHSIPTPIIHEVDADNPSSTICDDPQSIDSSMLQDGSDGLTRDLATDSKHSIKFILRTEGRKVVEASTFGLLQKSQTLPLWTGQSALGKERRATVA